MLVVAKSEHDPRWRCRHHQVGKAWSRPVTKADADEIDRLLRQQTQLTGRIRRAFMDAVNRLQDQVDVNQLAELLRQGRVQEAITQVSNTALRGGYSSVANAITQATIAAGVTAAATPELSAYNVSFGLTNPQTISFLQRYEMNLITGLSRDSLASVRQAIQAGVSAGRNPLDIARDIRSFIGLTPRQTQAVLNYRSYLENLDPAALARDLRDARFDSTVQSAIDSEQSLSSDYVDKVVQRYMDRMTAYRADTISRTEAMRSVNAGNHQLWSQAANDGTVAADQVTRQWVYTHDGLTRPWHRTIPAMNPDGVGLNEPFDTELGPLMYPGDPLGDPANTINCRCTVIYRVGPQP